MGIPWILALAAGAWAQAPEPSSERASAAAGASTFVREDPDYARRLFRQLDRNGDGYLTSDELKPAIGEEVNWVAVDRDRDGRIAPSEFTVIRSATR
jgi:Ca2+-binding EF-hand superfamily protein